ncbi:hypothetical protein GGTG_04995 [Gaeumannomyces tritici R3-111a-1]|uniref:2EXR domain-containing protein n=1 Tax=Gaeumannomyces tritici (strain R3-111a-1) TaxID=644352 RepID=J3NUN9_GAET3|nr:hypothetical protein GGTG_04995 [Gaeumannomyces tritici R3-111a-1]EJT79913.1 hypothetical protein GGTG_04995 [Gaeumannomyces tritici R3-111a-1]
MGLPIINKPLISIFIISPCHHRRSPVLRGHFLLLKLCYTSSKGSSRFQHNNPFDPNLVDAQDVFGPLTVLLRHHQYPHTVSRNGLPHAAYDSSLPEPAGGPALPTIQPFSVPVSRAGGPLSQPLVVGQRFSAPVSPVGFGQRLSPPVAPSTGPSSSLINPPAAPIPPRAMSISPASSPASSLPGKAHIGTVPEVQSWPSPDSRPRNFGDGFPLFGSLPVKIRDAIWRFAVEPRTVVIDVAATRITGAPRPFRAATAATWCAKEPTTQGVFLACRESYRAAAALYVRMPFPTPAFAADSGGGGLEPVDVSIATTLDTVEFSAGWLVDDDGFPVAAAARGASRQEYDGPDTLRLLLPLIGLTVIDQERQLWTPGWDGWSHRLRHISFNAVLVGHVAQGRRAGRGPNMGEIWDGLVRHMETSPSFRTCTIGIAVPKTTTSDALTRTSSQCDNIRRIRIARRPLHYAGATEDSDSESDSDPDDAARPPCSCSNWSSSRPSRAGGAPWSGRPPRLRIKRPGRIQSERAEAMRLDGSDACLLLDDRRLKLECRNHAPRQQVHTCPHHGSGRSSRLVPSYRHRLAILELLDAEQVAMFCPTRFPYESPLGFEPRRRAATTQLGTRMRHHYCAASCHVPQQFVHRQTQTHTHTWDQPAGPTFSAAPAAATPTQAAAQPSSTERRHFVFGDSFEGDMHLLLHNWVARYRDVESTRLNVGVHGLCREDYGW